MEVTKIDNRHPRSSGSTRPPCTRPYLFIHGIPVYVFLHTHTHSLRNGCTSDFRLRTLSSASLRIGSEPSLTHYCLLYLPSFQCPVYPFLPVPPRSPVAERELEDIGVTLPFSTYTFCGRYTGSTGVTCARPPPSRTATGESPPEVQTKWRKVRDDRKTQQYLPQCETGTSEHASGTSGTPRPHLYSLLPMGHRLP